MGVKFDTVINILKQREYGFYKSPKISCVDIVRSLLMDKNTVIDHVHKQSCSKPISYIENRIYYKHFSKCELFRGIGEPELLYQVNIPNEQYDFVAINSGSLSFLPESSMEYRNVFYILTKDCWLHVQNIETGKLIRKIFINHKDLCKFRHLTFEEELNRIYVTTNRFPRASHSNVIFSVIIFQIFPLELVGLVDLTTEIFGKNVKDIDINNDLLIILYGSKSQNLCATIYKFDDLFDNSNKLFDCQLDHYCEQLGGIVGTFPHGIPTNFKVKNVPEIVYSLRCTSESIIFSPLSNYYLFTPPNMAGQYQIYHTLSNQLIGTVGEIKSSFEKRYFDLEDDMILFDDMGRLIFVNFISREILFYGIDEDDNYDKETNEINKKLSLKFKLKSPTTDSDKLSLPSTRSTLSRKCKLKTFYEDEYKIFAFFYDPKMKISIVLAQMPRLATTGILLLYDGRSGEFMRSFDVPFSPEEFNRYDIYIYYDSMFILEGILGNSALCYTVHVYQLTRDWEDIDVC